MRKYFLALCAALLGACSGGVDNPPTPDPNGGFGNDVATTGLCACGSVVQATFGWLKAGPGQFGVGYIRLETDGQPQGWEPCTIAATSGKCTVGIKLDPNIPTPKWAQPALMSAGGVGLTGKMQNFPLPICSSCNAP